jgi:hypothetical protein
LDYKNIPVWDTFLKKTNSLEGAQIADKGVKTYCVSKNAQTQACKRANSPTRQRRTIRVKNRILTD